MTWIAILVLVVFSAWQGRKIQLLNKRLVGAELVLNKYSTSFQEFMAEQAVNLEGELEKIKTETDAKVGAAASKVEAKFNTISQAVDKSVSEAQKEVQAGAFKLKVQAKELIEHQLSDFQTLMKNAYLDEYEKMRKNPPRPKKGPRKKVDPPSQYRSLDDE